MSKPTPAPAATQTAEQQRQAAFIGWLSCPAFIAVLLAAATFAVYWPAISFDFINLDDHEYFAGNRHVLAGLSWSGVAWAFQTTQNSSWYPLSWLSFMLDAQLFGRGPIGPHLTNLLLHVANGILLFLLLRGLTGSQWRSALVAALFALHPLHVESVAWVAERKGVLSTFFGLLALLAYLRFANSGTRGSKLDLRAYGLALLFFALGLLSKPVLVTLPFAMLLLDYWPLRRFAPLPGDPQPVGIPRLLLEKVPFLVLALGVAAANVLVHRKSGAMATLAAMPIPARIENALVAHARYLGQTLWPMNLTFPYLHPGHWPAASVVLGLVVVAGLGLAAVWLGRRRPYLLVGWGWFLVMLVPVIGLVQSGSQSMADRYTYVPSIGLFLMLVWGLGEMLERWRLPKPAIACAALLMLLALSFRSADQLRYWQSSEALFRHAIETTTHNYVAYDALGTALDDQGKFEEALALFSESVRLQPHYAAAQYDLGTALMRKGKPEEALRHLTAALKEDPKFALAHINLGKLLLEQGKLDEAADHFSQAVRLTPDDPEAQYNLGTLLVMQAKLELGIACFLEALRLRPDYGEAHSNLGIALMRQGKLGEGADHLAAASRLNPNNPEAHHNLGLALLELNRPREAAEQFADALRLNPDAPGAHYHLALALVRQDKPKEALPHAQKARDLALAAGQSALAAKAEELLKQLR